MIEATIEDIEREFWLRQRNNGELVWKTKKGERIPVKDLTDSHLNNIMKYAEKQQDYENKILEGLSCL